MLFTNSFFVNVDCSIQSSLLGDKIRNEEVINSKRNRISSLKVFQVLLNYRRSSVPKDIYFIRRFVSELIEYARINTRITQGPRFEKNK